MCGAQLSDWLISTDSQRIMSSPVVVDVSFWSALVSDTRLRGLVECLSPEERLRAEKIRDKLAAREFIAGRSVMKQLLSTYCGADAANLSLKYGSSGKPYIEDGNVAFNLSHSAGTCALALGRVKNLGIDVELVSSGAHIVADDVFNPDEAEQFAALPLSEQTEAFFRAWVVKEAYLKATGEGLAGGMKSLEVRFAPGPVAVPVAIQGRDDFAKWRFSSFDVGAGLVGAVAVDAADRDMEIRIEHLNI